VVLAVVWTGLRASLFVIRQRRAQRVYRQRSRRADGKMYPPIISGVCDGCGRASKVYYAESGEKLCATCYEASWRQAE
jgi:hypothetical protein